MENNVISSQKFSEKRPQKKKEFRPEDINYKIDRETRLAIHYLKLFCIKNALWLIPLVVFLTLAVIMDIFAIFFIWKNPSILFLQLKKSYIWVLTYIAGLYTDEIRKKMTKH